MIIFCFLFNHFLRLISTQARQMRPPRGGIYKLLPFISCPRMQKFLLGRLPFATASCMFSWCVHLKTWLGLTHEGLSHLWQRQLFPRGRLKYHIHANRWERNNFFFSPKRPYPAPTLCPSHSQHSVFLPTLTFDQKRATSSGVNSDG